MGAGAGHNRSRYYVAGAQRDVAAIRRPFSHRPLESNYPVVVAVFVLMLEIEGLADPAMASQRSRSTTITVFGATC